MSLAWVAISQAEESLVASDLSPLPTTETLARSATSSTANSLSRSAANISTTSSRRRASRIRRSPDSDGRDVELAVAAAEKAFADWSRTAAAERSRILLRIADLIERDLEKFARAESIDTGKPLSLARSLDIPRAVEQFSLLCDRDSAHGERGAHHGWRRLQLHAAPAARHRRA